MCQTFAPALLRIACADQSPTPRNHPMHSILCTGVPLLPPREADVTITQRICTPGARPLDVSRAANPWSNLVWSEVAAGMPRRVAGPVPFRLSRCRRTLAANSRLIIPSTTNPILNPIKHIFIPIFCILQQSSYVLYPMYLLQTAPKRKSGKYLWTMPSCERSKRSSESTSFGNWSGTSFKAENSRSCVSSLSIT